MCRICILCVTRHRGALIDQAHLLIDQAHLYFAFPCIECGINA
jgi:hypothetical protein